jgi:hypothetical protein
MAPGRKPRPAPQVLLPPVPARSYFGELNRYEK